MILRACCTRTAARWANPSTPPTANDNLAERNGADGGAGHGFVLRGQQWVALRNVARFNKRDGFFFAFAAFVTLGDGTDANRNLAERNLMDGFDIQDLDGVLLDNNLARNNGGEGIENNAIGTGLLNNTSTGNRIDCANSGMIAADAGNVCADGSDFGVPPEVEKQEQAPSGARAKADKAEINKDRGRR